jgi:hypothetical protein
MAEGQGQFTRDPTYSEYAALRHCTITHTTMLGNGDSTLDPVLVDVLEQFMSDMKAYAGHAVDLRDSATNYITTSLYALFTGTASSDDLQLQQCKMLMQDITVCCGREGMKLDMAPWLRYLGNDMFLKLKQAVKTKAVLWDKMWSNVNGKNTRLVSIEFCLFCL